MNANEIIVIVLIFAISYWFVFIQLEKEYFKKQK